MSETLKTERETWLENKDRLVNEFEGQWVLIKNIHILGIRKTYEEALTMGYEICGNQAFMVHQIQEVEEVVQF